MSYPNARHDYAVGNGGLRTAAAMADKPVQRASLKEKLAAYKAQVSGAGRADTEKEKRRKRCNNQISTIVRAAIKKFRLI